MLSGLTDLGDQLVKGLVALPYREDDTSLQAYFVLDHDPKYYEIVQETITQGRDVMSYVCLVTPEGNVMAAWSYPDMLANFKLFYA